jgi:hypothetical protein
MYDMLLFDRDATLLLYDDRYSLDALLMATICVRVT